MSGKDSSEVFLPEQSAQQARAQIEQWAPPGTPLSEAAKALESHGFSCAPATPATAGIHASVLCQFKTRAPLPPGERVSAPGTPVSWFVTLNSNDGAALSEAQISRLPKDIGG